MPDDASPPVCRAPPRAPCSPRRVAAANPTPRPRTSSTDPRRRPLRTTSLGADHQRCRRPRRNLPRRPRRRRRRRRRPRGIRLLLAKPEAAAKPAPAAAVPRAGAEPTVRFPRNEAARRRGSQRLGRASPGRRVEPHGGLLVDRGLPGGALAAAVGAGELLGLRRQAARGGRWSSTRRSPTRPPQPSPGSTPCSSGSAR